MSERQTFGKSTCKQCGSPLAFYRLPNGKACPCEPDGSDHWDKCRTIRYAKAKQGKLVTHQDGPGYVQQYERPGDKPFVVMQSSGVIPARKKAKQ